MARQRGVVHPYQPHLDVREGRVRDAFLTRITEQRHQMVDSGLPSDVDAAQQAPIAHVDGCMFREEHEHQHLRLFLLDGDGAAVAPVAQPFLRGFGRPPRRGLG